MGVVVCRKPTLWILLAAIAFYHFDDFHTPLQIRLLRIFVANCQNINVPARQKRINVKSRFLGMGDASLRYAVDVAAFRPHESKAGFSFFQSSAIVKELADSLEILEAGNHFTLMAF